MTAWEMYLDDFDILRELPHRLLPWYEKHKRALPWRETEEPYRVWLSEIMLQQTRVEAVKGYYARFLEHCPTVEALAKAPEDTLTKLWEGLGYYSRVRNLKKAALEIMEHHGGSFPRDYSSVRALPGIGDYTAGAICSIALGLPTPAVDGNVLRVLARLLLWQEEIDLPAVKKRAAEQLAQIYPQREPGSFTQALMELGATVCLPHGEPRCHACPMAELCRAHREGVPTQYPRRSPKRARRREEKTVLILSCGEYIALRRRENRGLLAGLWEFPHVEGLLSEDAAVDTALSWGVSPYELRRRADRNHVFTHIEWKLRAYRIDCQKMPDCFHWMTRQEVEKEAALPTAFRQFWDLVE